MHDDMSAKLVEHNKISANLKKENDSCGICDRLSLKIRFWPNGARVLVPNFFFDSCNSCHPDLDAFEIVSSQVADL